MRTKQSPIFIIILVVLFIGLIGGAMYIQIREYHSKTDPVLNSIMEKLHPLFTEEYYNGELEELNTRNILNEISVRSGNKSYTINKEKVYICLKDENNNYYDENMLMYVILHELSHVICDEIGHTDKFHRIFDEILDRATQKGIYNPNVPIIRDYCQYND